jgi:hypothetical protein
MTKEGEQSHKSGFSFLLLQFAVSAIPLVKPAAESESPTPAPPDDSCPFGLQFAVIREDQLPDGVMPPLDWFYEDARNDTGQYALQQYSFLEEVYKAPSSSNASRSSSTNEPTAEPEDFSGNNTRVHFLAKRHCEALFRAGVMQAWQPNNSAAAPADGLYMGANTMPTDAQKQEAAAWLASSESQVVPLVIDKAKDRWKAFGGIKPSRGLQENCTLCSNATFYVYFHSCNASDPSLQGYKPVEFLVRTEVVMKPLSGAKRSECLYKADQSIEIFNKYIALPLAMGFVVIVVLLTWIPGVWKWAVGKIRARG